MLALGFMAFWLLSSVAGVGFTGWLIRRRWGNQKRTSLVLKLVSMVVVLAALFGAVGTCLGVMQAFGAVGGERIDPSQKARILAEGIAAAMNWTALGVIVWLPGTLALLLITRAGKERPPAE
jgi:biopolymer transport protein ExbB/TolQ